MSEGAALVLQDVRRETRAAVMSMSFIDSPGEEGGHNEEKAKGWDDQSTIYRRTFLYRAPEQCSAGFLIDLMFKSSMPYWTGAGLLAMH